MFVEGLYTNRNASDQWNQSGLLPGLFADSQENVEQYGVTAEVKAILPYSWHLSLTGDYSHDRVAADSQALYFGTDISPQNTLFGDGLGSVELLADGPVITLPSGVVRAAIGGGYRNETFTETTIPATPGFLFNDSRSIEYAFAELSVPLVSASTTRIGLNSLDLDLSGQFEHYSDFGQTTNPKVAISYKPIEDLKISAAWGTSFRAPSLFEEFDPTGATLRLDTDPSSPTGTAVALQRSGGNPSLQPETATTIAVDVKYNPTWEPQLTLGVNFFDIQYHNRIGFPINIFTSALIDSSVAAFVHPNPTAAEQQAIIQAASNFRNLTGLPYNPAAVVAVVDNRYQNFARSAPRVSI